MTKPYTFVEALADMQRAMEEHSWWKLRVDGTPLANDLPVRAATLMIEKLREASGSRKSFICRARRQTSRAARRPVPRHRGYSRASVNRNIRKGRCAMTPDPTPDFLAPQKTLRPRRLRAPDRAQPTPEPTDDHGEVWGAVALIGAVALLGLLVWWLS